MVRDFHQWRWRRLWISAYREEGKWSLVVWWRHVRVLIVNRPTYVVGRSWWWRLHS